MALNFRDHIIHPLQGLAGHIFFILIRLLPLGMASGFGGWLGRSLGPHLGVTERARHNLKRAFPEKSNNEIETIVRAMWDNLGRTFIEYPLRDRLRFEGQGAEVELIGVENIERLRDDGKPGIFFSGHLANWEVPQLGIVRNGIPLHIVYRTPNNPYVKGLFNRRQLGEGELIPKGSKGARQAIKLLSEGGHLGMLVDQKMNDGIAVPFFGRDAMTAPALAQFALKYDCPVVPGKIERLSGCRFRVTYFPPLEITPSGDRHADIATITAKVNDILEEWIRERPEQWLWLHNRWPD
ncbi:MAG: lauroyl acyltransferase [Rhodospirillaceae bacterium]|nr:lauroyl acyltransferase [Rhodospirillaceae bacterium]